MAHGTVYSCGSLIVDVVIEVPGLPARGGDMLGTGTRTHVGGGFNLAAAVARQGVRCVSTAPHGTGPYGSLIRAALADEGVEASARQRPEGDSGFCVTFLEPDAERTFVTVPGVESDLRPDDLAPLRPEAGDFVALSGYDLIYPGSGPVLARWLTDLPPEVRVVLDPGPLVDQIPTTFLTGVLGRAAVLTLNQREARLLGDAPESTGEALLKAVRSRVPDPTIVIVREGAAGCVVATGDRVLTVPAPAVRPVDTTGAGDAHTGVLLAALVDGAELADALDLATRAAAIAVTRAGPATTPTREELDLVGRR